MTAGLRSDEVVVGVLRPQALPDGDRLNRWLSGDELAAMERLRFDEDRRSYAAAHALRRLMVACALHADASEVVFAAGASGQPLLTSHPDAALHFSHSRSRAAVACAVTRFAPVGVDVEPIEPARADLELLRPFVADAPHDFFATWVALEAFWKCQGRGLADDNPRIRLRPHPSGRCAVLSEAGATTGQVTALAAPPGCAAAVALAVPPSTAVRIRMFGCASIAVLERRCAGHVTDLARSELTE